MMPPPRIPQLFEKANTKILQFSIFRSVYNSPKRATSEFLRSCLLEIIFFLKAQSSKTPNVFYHATNNADSCVDLLCNGENQLNYSSYTSFTIYNFVFV